MPPGLVVDSTKTATDNVQIDGKASESSFPNNSWADNQTYDDFKGGGFENSFLELLDVVYVDAIDGNVLIGYSAGNGAVSTNTDGVKYNVGIGQKSLEGINGGQGNTTIGYEAGKSISSGDGNIIIGSGSLGASAWNSELNNQLRIGNADLIVISGSLETGDIIFASTASAAYFSGDGSQLTNLPASSTFPFTGDAQITGSLIVSQSGNPGLTVFGSGSTVFNIIGSEGTLFAIEDDLDGTLFTVNDRSGIPMFEVSASGRIVAEEGESIIRSQRPIVTHTADFSITSSLDYAGKYHIVGGSITCSINTGSLVPTGAEFEFFQTSSAGNFLFITGSPHVDVIVKNDNMNLAGQGSGASLKYIGGSTFHLVGDLT